MDDDRGDDAASRASLREHFEFEHQRGDDPWRVTTRWYEIRKRAVTLASLPEETYRSTLEIGCSIGVLTEALATRSEKVLAVDVAESAIRRASERLEPHTHVRVEKFDAGDGLPEGPWDLVVLSEVGYYLPAEQLVALVSRIEDQLAPSGVFVACHWRHDEDDFVQAGDAVHRQIAFETVLSRLVHHEEADFVLDVYSADERSVARRTGLV